LHLGFFVINFLIAINIFRVNRCVNCDQSAALLLSTNRKSYASSTQLAVGTTTDDLELP